MPFTRSNFAVSTSRSTQAPRGWFHGNDGLGNRGYPPPQRVPEESPAVEAITETATNQMDPVIPLSQAEEEKSPARVRNFWLSGSNGKGNPNCFRRSECPPSQKASTVTGGLVKLQVVKALILTAAILINLIP
jgi:hypothetical protein